MKDDCFRYRAGAALLAMFSAVSVLYAMPSAAQGVEYPSAVKTFQKICLMPGVVPADRLAAIGAESGWQEDKGVTFDIPKMGFSKAIDQNYSFSKVESARQWSGDIDGHKAYIVLATFAGEPRYKNICALILDGPPNALPYGRDLRSAFKTYGIGGKSVDLVHYYEFAGKIGEDKHPVRGEIFSRSLAGTSKETTHIYVAY